MLKGLLMAGAVAAGLAVSPIAASTAGAVPAIKPDGVAKSGLVEKVRKGGMGGGMRGFGGGGMRGISGGGMRSMGGGGMRAFRGSNASSFRRLGPGVRHTGGVGRLYRHRGHHHHHHHRRWRGYPYYYGYPVYGAAYYYGSSYYGECGWLRRKAARTGSSYWWRRYDACISGY
jgi:hypothetical protein